jgi:hypothetical protein
MGRSHIIWLLSLDDGVISISSLWCFYVNNPVSSEALRYQHGSTGQLALNRKKISTFSYTNIRVKVGYLCSIQYLSLGDIAPLYPILPLPLLLPLSHPLPLPLPPPPPSLTVKLSGQGLGKSQKGSLSEFPCFKVESLTSSPPPTSPLPLFPIVFLTNLLPLL